MSYKRDEGGILGLFKKYGYVKEVSIVPGPNGHMSKGIAFVKMAKRDEALKAIKDLNGKVLDGRTLKVSEAISRFHKEKGPASEEKKVPKRRKRPTSFLSKFKKA